MKDTLLRELYRSDIDWILATGRQQEFSANEIVIPAGRVMDTFGILLEGTLSVNYFEPENNPLASAFAKLEEDSQNTNKGLEIFQLKSGEVIGEDCLLGNYSTNDLEIRASEPSQLISIPLMQLEAKMERDVEFAARFYRAIAVILANRLESAIAEIGRRRFAPVRTARDVLFVFAQLHDSDIDWAVSNGQVMTVANNKVLVRQGSPIDGFYILLEGMMSVSLDQSQSDTLSRVFKALDSDETSEVSGKELTKLHQGEILGETTFIDGRLFYATIRALENSSVLKISRQQLGIKLQQDLGFASRFYRAIAILLSYRLQELITRLGYGRHTYSQDSPLDEDELDPDLIEQISIAATRFNSMLERLGCFAK